MFGVVVIVVAGIALLVVGVVVLVRHVRGLHLVSPILLDEALDADLRRFRAALRKSDLSVDQRRSLGRLLIAIAARRASGDSGSGDGSALDDRAELEGAWRTMRRLLSAERRGVDRSRTAR